MSSRSFRQTHAVTRSRLSPIMALSLLSLLLLSLSPIASQAQLGAPDLEIWPDPQVQLPIPKGWHRLEASWVAERILIATPTLLAVDELLAGEEVDVPAIVHVKIDALDPILAAIPLQSIADGIVAELAKQSEEDTVDFEVIRWEEADAKGRDAFIVATRRGETINHSLFVRTEGYLYEVSVSYERESANEFEGLVDPIFAGFEPRSIPSGALAIEQRETLLARLSTPLGWHEHTVEGALPQVVVSEEDASLTGGRFRTGISLLKISQFRKAFNLPDTASIDDLYELWLHTYFAGIESVPHRLLQVVEIVIDSGHSLLIEASFEDSNTGHFTQLFNVVTAMGDDFYIATFEAPVEEFFLLRSAFVESIASLRWR